MSETIRARLGFVTLGPASGPHFSSMQLLVPPDVRWDPEVLGLYGKTHEDIRGIHEVIVNRVRPLAQQHQWQGVTLAAAMVEIMNPGIRERLQDALKVPVTTALDSVIPALRAFKARRIALITPMDEAANGPIREHLRSVGIEAYSPASVIKNYLDAGNLGPDDVYAIAEKALKQVPPVDAVYFQAAILDPIRVLDRMERHLGVPVVASLPAMLWRILSKLGLRYKISGYGRLLKEWPKAPE
ncbi:MAG: hypothetical protein HY535_07520 [Chloroflexi bacterium]|nr:hypothetical protein [Chloroflexota bacterium]